MRKQILPCGAALLLGSAVAVVSSTAAAYNLVDRNGTELNLDIELIVGLFSSEETYGNSESSPSWTEGYAKCGLSGSRDLDRGHARFAISRPFPY